MSDTQLSHEISDKTWDLLQPHLPGRAGQWGRVAQNNRRFINAVLWFLYTGARWTNLPAEYGNWNTVHQRFRRWRQNGSWEKALEILIDDPAYDWLILNTAALAARRQAKNAADVQKKLSAQASSPEECLFPWMRMVCQSKILLCAVPQIVVDKLLGIRDNGAKRPR
jgi:transposase